MKNLMTEKVYQQTTRIIDVSRSYSGETKPYATAAKLARR